MDNRINDIRRKIKTLRTNMLRAESVMRGQINREEDCTQVAEELLHMRVAMSELVREREALGDREPILVERYFIPRRPLSEPRPAASRNERRPQTGAVTVAVDFKGRNTPC
jgi:hypothetical protein